MSVCVWCVVGDLNPSKKVKSVVVMCVSVTVVCYFFVFQLFGFHESRGMCLFLHLAIAGYGCGDGGGFTMGYV